MKGRDVVARLKAKGAMDEDEKYTAVYERDPSGAWLVHIREVSGCHTYGKSIAQARERIREALGLFVDDADSVQIDDDIALPRDAKKALNALRTVRDQLQKQQRRAAASQLMAIRKLRELGLSTRDTSEVAGLSHQRVAQILAEAEE